MRKEKQRGSMIFITNMFFICKIKIYFFKKRIYLENMTTIMSKLGNVIVTDQNGANILPLLQMQLNRDNTKKD